MKISAYNIAVDLFGRILDIFSERVPYVDVYSNMLRRKGGEIILDHIGFRTFNTHTGEQPGGIYAISHIFDCLGYRQVEKYDYKKKNVKAAYFKTEKENGLPLVYVSQLDVENLPEWSGKVLEEVLNETKYLLADEAIELMDKLGKDKMLTYEAAVILESELIKYFNRPWGMPKKKLILKINDVSHYGAWLLLHGNAPSHIAVSIDKNKIEGWNDIEYVCRKLKNAGIPMKENIEGERNTIIRQAATLAVKEEIDVLGEYGKEKIVWTYAYLEFVKREFIKSNKDIYKFLGFINKHEKELYELTKTLDN